MINFLLTGKDRIVLLIVDNVDVDKLLPAPFDLNLDNVFYFILKAFFDLRIFKFLSRLFGHVKKTDLLER